MVSELKERANSILLEVDKIIVQCIPTNEDGMYEGNIGLCLYHFYFAHVLNIPERNDYGGILINDIYEKIQNGQSSLAGYNLSNGIIGYCLLLQILNKEQFIEIDINESLFEIEEYIYDACLEDIKESKIDNLHQAMGGLYYFAIRSDFPKKVEYLESLVDLLYSKRIVDHLGGRFLCSSGPNNGKGYDLSFAHGLIGMLYILLKIYKCGVKKEHIKSMLTEGLQFLINFENNDPSTRNEVMFPIFINSTDMQPVYSSMLGWCYGDLNMLLLLMELEGAAFNHKYLDHINPLIEAVKSRSATMSKVRDSHLCHGSSGLCLMMKHLNGLSNDFRLKEAYHNWFEIFEKQIVNDLKKNIYKGKELQLLEGLVGVGLVCLSIISEKEAVWKEAILL